MLRVITLFIYFTVCSLSHQCFAQQTIQGKVVDKNTNEPLESALISINKNQTLTDKNGKFILTLNNIHDSITVSFVGYQTTVVSINKNETMLIQLQRGSVDLKDVVISTKLNSITSSRTLSSLDLNMKPARSAQDLLRLVPGLFIAQQVGGGKAEQIFLRGFNADHGTDVNISVDNVPVNLVSQAHGQGWADLHFLIPETVGSYDFGKGSYYADKGDFCTAGYVNYNTLNVLENNTIKVEAGQFNTERAVAMINILNNAAKQRGQTAYIAGEALYTNGPFDYRQHFQRYNLFGKFNSQLGVNNKITVTLSAFTSLWRASGEIPNRAMNEGYIQDRFGVLDSGQRGATNKTIANIKLTTSLKNNFLLENQVYYLHTFFQLFTNFTFFYVDPINGDEFNQHEVRDTYGYNGKLSHKVILGNSALTSTAGISFKYDHTHPSWLAHSINGDSILNFLQLGIIKEVNSNAYIDETLENGRWLFNVGVRADYFNFYYRNIAPSSDSAAKIYDGLKTNQNKISINPKINIQYTLNNQAQLYIKTGRGFHSNDARVVIANKGYEILPAAYTADAGINWKPLPHLYINTALWYIYLQQEFTYGSDFGDESVQPGGKTVRKGIDFSARYQITRWLFGDANANLAKPRTLNEPKGENYIADAPTFTSTAGLYFKLTNGFNGGISYRYMHNGPANEDNSLTAKGYFLTDFTANYTKKNYEIGISIENLFNVKWDETEIEYVSRLKYETSPVDELSYTAGVPFFAKLKFSVFF